MQRFKNILVLYNEYVGDEATLSRAVALAKQNKAFLTVFEVKRPGLYEPDSMDERQVRLERLIVSIKDEGVDVRAKVSSGTPFLEIIYQVLSNNHDLVMMTADSQEGLKPLLFGSTSMHLMRKCPCPVWVSKPSHHPQYARVLAAVDTDYTSTQEEELNIQIMELAISLVKSEGAMLDIVCVWETTSADTDTLRSESSEQIRENLLQKYEKATQLKLEHLLSRFSMEEIDHRVHLVQGVAGILIPEVAAKMNSDLIVMGTVCRTGIPGFFIGNTAETVLQLVDCSVLTLKPTGFISPVVEFEQH